ncbi:MAG: hypothetical protein L6262_08865 [Weeksellaceae bacterium]|nr:hypothetical protein [Weeksellaceae bacterium]
MKSIKIYSLLLIFSVSSVACEVRTAGNSGNIPPGQAKKIYGTKSAKPFAPGQNK